MSDCPAGYSLAASYVVTASHACCKNFMTPTRMDLQLRRDAKATEFRAVEIRFYIVIIAQLT